MKKKIFLNKIEEENKNKISPTNFIFDESANILEIKKLGLKSEIITDINDYSFFFLITNINNLYRWKNIEWIKNISLKPDNYYNKLFVCQKRKIWKDLLKKIFVSKVFIQIITNFYGEKEINILQDDSIIDAIINNIRFFIYETNYFGITHDYSLITYEYGLYKNNGDKNESVRLLIYYGFFIVCNIHEIGGNVYVRLKFYSTLESEYQSSNIGEFNKNKYTLEGIQRQKESGESIEIELFDRVIEVLTIKEALYLLNINNYSKNIKTFKEQFINCNNLTYDELIPNTLKDLLNLLGINEKEIRANDNQSFKMPNKIVNNPDLYKPGYSKIYHGPEHRHPLTFYYKAEKIFKSPLEELKKEFEKYINIKYD